MNFDVGNKLIKKVSINIGPEKTNYKCCQKCGKIWQKIFDKEFEILKRQLRNREGNLLFCFDCDPKKNKTLF